MKKHFKVKNAREERVDVLFGKNPERKTVSVKKVVVVVFFDKQGNIIVQKRDKAVSKVGEKYGFFGGQIEKGETPRQAVARELKEELGYVPEKLNYWGEFFFKIKEKNQPCYSGWLIKCYVFLSPITVKLERSIVKEGAGMVKLTIEEAIEGKGFPSGADSTMFLRKVRKLVLKQEKEVPMNRRK